MDLYGVNILKGNGPQEIVFSWDIKTSPHNNGIIRCLREHHILSDDEAEAMTGIIENLEASLQQRLPQGSLEMRADVLHFYVYLASEFNDETSRKYESMLSPPELERANRFKLSHIRENYIFTTR